MQPDRRGTQADSLYVLSQNPAYLRLRLLYDFGFDSCIFGQPRSQPRGRAVTANLRTKIPEFRGFDSVIILILRGGLLMCIGKFPETLTQQILEVLVGIILVG